MAALCKGHQLSTGDARSLRQGPISATMITEDRGAHAQLYFYASDIENQAVRQFVIVIVAAKIL